MEAQLYFQEYSYKNVSKIHVNNEEVYYTTGKTRLIFSNEISLFNIKDNSKKLTSKLKFGFPPKLRIEMQDGIIYDLKMVGLQALQYTCAVGANKYEIFQHKDRKHSILKNGLMVAYIDKKEFAKFGNDQYTIIADDDSDIELFIAFALMLHLFHGSQKDQIASLDKGNYWEKRAFDTSWQPKPTN